MTRLYLESELKPGAELALPAEAVHHLRAVRLRPGDPLVLFNGRGGEHPCRLEHLDRREAVVRVEGHRERDREPPLEVVLVQGIAKGDRMDFTVQKGVELGVARIVPVFTDHGVVQLDDRRGEKRRGHWQRVAISACEQCGRNRVPTVEAPRPLAALWKELAAGAAAALDPEGDVSPRGLRIGRGPFYLLVGPEGGLSAPELEEAGRRGIRRLRLGPRVLRTETAGPIALAALQTLYGDLG